MAELAFYLLGALALTAAFQGVRMMAAPYFGQGRDWTRRLSRWTAAGPGAPPTVASANWLEAQIDVQAPFVRRRLIAAGAKFRPDQLLAGAVLLSATLALALRLLGLGLFPSILLGAGAGGGGSALVLTVMIKRRRKLFMVQMPQTVDLIARSLQAGHPVTTAISVAARQMPDPIGPELAEVMAEINFGLDRDAAFRNLLLRFPLTELRLLVASLEVTRETGGNIAEVLLKLSETMRAKAQLRKKVQAISAEGRLTLLVVSALPPIVALGITAFRPGYYSEVASDPLFWPLMSGPPILILIGALIISRMINFKI
jgi:tight adherence protein B